MRSSAMKCSLLYMDGHSTNKLTAAVATCRESTHHSISQYSIKDGEGLNKHSFLPEAVNACWKWAHCYLKFSVVQDQQVTCLL